MKNLPSIIVLLLLASCDYNSKLEESTQNTVTNLEVEPVKWNMLDSIDITDFNRDLVQGKPTMDVGIYFPSNFDKDFDKVTLSSSWKV